jgi:hypothetical protein
MNKKITKAYSHEDWVKEQMKDPEFVKALNEPDEDSGVQMAYNLQQLRKKTILEAKRRGIKLSEKQIFKKIS